MFVFLSSHQIRLPFQNERYQQSLNMTVCSFPGQEAGGVPALSKTGSSQIKK